LLFLQEQRGARDPIARPRPAAGAPGPRLPRGSRQRWPQIRGKVTGKRFPVCAEQVARARGRIAGFQLADWVLPLPADWMLGRGHLGDGDIDLAWITAQVLAAGYGGYAEVEIFRQEVWDAPPEDTAATVRQRFEDLRYSLPSSSSR